MADDAAPALIGGFIPGEGPSPEATTVPLKPPVVVLLFMGEVAARLPVAREPVEEIAGRGSGIRPN